MKPVVEESTKQFIRSLINCKGKGYHADVEKLRELIK